MTNRYLEKIAFNVKGAPWDKAPGSPPPAPGGLGNALRKVKVFAKRNPVMAGAAVVGASVMGGRLLERRSNNQLQPYPHNDYF